MLRSTIIAIVLITWLRDRRLPYDRGDVPGLWRELVPPISAAVFGVELESNKRGLFHFIDGKEDVCYLSRLEIFLIKYVDFHRQQSAKTIKIISTAVSIIVSIETKGRKRAIFGLYKWKVHRG